MADGGSYVPAIQAVRHQTELEGILGGLEESRPDWDSLILRASSFVRRLEQSHPEQALLQIVDQMEQVLRTRDRQRAQLWVESTMRVLEKVSSQMPSWPLRAAAAAR